MPPRRHLTGVRLPSLPPTRGPPRPLPLPALETARRRARSAGETLSLDAELPLFTASAVSKPKRVRDRLHPRWLHRGSEPSPAAPPAPGGWHCRQATPYLAARGGRRPGRPSGRRRGCSPRGPSRSPASPARSAPASSCPRWSGARPRRSRRG